LPEPFKTKGSYKALVATKKLYLYSAMSLAQAPENVGAGKTTPPLLLKSGSTLTAQDLSLDPNLSKYRDTVLLTLQISVEE